MLAGEGFCDIERLIEKMRRACSGAGSTASLAWNAIRGIEAALWDSKASTLAGLAALGGPFPGRGVPLRRLASGRSS